MPTHTQRTDETPTEEFCLSEDL